MGGINATYDSSLDPKARDTIKDMVDRLNATLSTRSVDLNITSDISQLTPGNQIRARMGAANYTSTTKVKNDTFFVNKEFNYAGYATTDIQSWMHELVHVAFPGVAGRVAGKEETHEEEIYEKLAVVSDIVGIKFSNSDLGKWKDQLRAKGLPEDSIEAITEDYADTDPAHEAHCFLADTPILMADGSEKPIQDIRPGDMVMAFDPRANNGLGDRQPARVRRTFQNVTKSIIDLRGLRMTPGHVVLSDNGEWLKVMDVLRRDRAMVEERKDGPVLVRARTGMVIGSEEDAPVTVLFADREGRPHKAVVRAGIICIAERRADGSGEGWSLARVLRHQNYTIHPDGTLTGADGRFYNATPWPGGTPLDAPFQEDWVISLDDRPSMPAWIAGLRDDDEAQAVNEVHTFAAARPFASNLNRKERRRLAALRVVKN